MRVARNKKKIVILGGGFAGMECTRQLEQYFKNDSEIEIVIFSEDNFLLFTPMLPQVASGMIETRHIVTPIRTMTKKGVILRGQDQEHRSVWKGCKSCGETGTKRGISLHYDFLVVALGSETNFFGMSDLEK